MKKLLTSFLVLLFCVSCGSSCGKKKKEILEVYTPSFIVKDTFETYTNRMEATPFVWNNQVYMMVSARELNPSRVEIYLGTTLISSLNTAIHFASVIVENNTLYLFGTLTNSIVRIESTDLINWSAPINIFTNPFPNSQLYNNSVTKKTNGGYVMSYETCEPNTQCFNIRFLESSDLINWTQAGTIFSPQAYAACPTIRELNGVYYMFYLRDVGHWATYVARSTDLINWETSPQVVLSALATGGETNNNSDMDLVEFGGEIIINYAVGDQQTYSGIKLARFQGTFQDFVNRFF